MQVATGIHHVERNQFRAAVERLEEAIRAIDAITNDRGYDFARLRDDVRALLPKIVARSKGAKERIEWPTVLTKS